VRESDRFCPECGGRLREAPVAPATSPAPAAEPPVSPAPQPTPPAAGPLTPDLSQMTEMRGAAPAVCQPDVTPKQGSSAVKWIAIALAILVLGCCGCTMILVLFMLGSDASSSLVPLGDFLRSLLLR